MKIQCVVLRVDGNIKKKCRLKQLFQSFLHHKNKNFIANEENCKQIINKAVELKSLILHM